ncbi:MAG TPA: radical SAM protein [Candidatus Methylomirabilis sp.]|nr:radical SAM protein [Candidatus Methylomirabilis sp.]
MTPRVALPAFRVPSGPSVAAALYPGATNLALDGTRSLSFDRAGRLIRAFWDGRSIRRSLDDRYVEKRKTGAYPWSSARRELDPTGREALLKAIACEVSAIRRGLDRGPGLLPDDGRLELAARLQDILRWTPGALEADARRFRSIYLPVPILPPDQYGALVVQVTEGCSYNQCTFCRLYRGRPFHVKSPGELRAHVRGVREFFGEGLRLRTGIFLADANALVLPPARLLDVLSLLHAELPIGPGGLRGVYSFIDAFSGAPKSAEELRELAGQGLRRVYLGLESGCDDLLQLLGKPATAAEALDLVARLREAGVHVGIIALLGIGGDRYGERHLTDTLAAVNAMRLGKQDLLCLSPLAADPDSVYRQREREAGIRPLTEAETDAQLRALKAGLRFDPRGRPKVALYDIRDFVY